MEQLFFSLHYLIVVKRALDIIWKCSDRVMSFLQTYQNILRMAMKVSVDKLIKTGLPLTKIIFADILITNSSIYASELNVIARDIL
jgi:hypothetical protein